jgi:hypothetical protein
MTTIVLCAVNVSIDPIRNIRQYTHDVEQNVIVISRLRFILFSEKKNKLHLIHDAHHQYDQMLFVQKFQFNQISHTNLFRIVDDIFIVIECTIFRVLRCVRFARTHWYHYVAITNKRREKMNSHCNNDDSSCIIRCERTFVHDCRYWVQ